MRYYSRNTLPDDLKQVGIILHILMLTDYYPPHISGGVEKVVAELCKGLSTKGHRLSVLTLNHGSASAIERNGLIDIYRLPSIQLTKVFKLQYTTSVFILPKLVQLIRQLKPTIIHANNRYFSTTMMLSLLRPFICTPVVTTLHIGNLHDKSNRLNAVFDVYDRSIGKCIIKGSSHVIAVSNGVAKYARSICGDSVKLSVIPNGVDADIFYPENDMHNSLKTVLFVGRLLRNKGPETLIRAIPEVLAKHPQTQFVLVGDGPLKDRLQRLCYDFKVLHAAQFLGVRKDVPELMRRSSVFVRPSSLEGMSLTILEAMASGLPVVATPVSGTTELIKDGHNGYFTAIADHKMLAQKITALLDDRSLAKQMGQRGRDMVCGEYRWDSVVNGTERIYSEEAVVN